MLKSESVIFTYDGVSKFNFPDVQLEKGESLLVLGDSGVGKTTFIQILAGLLKSESGKVELSNTDYNKLSPKEMDQFRGKYIGMIFQKPYFVQNLNIIDNLLLSLSLFWSSILNIFTSRNKCYITNCRSCITAIPSYWLNI